MGTFHKETHMTTAGRISAGKFSEFDHMFISEMLVSSFYVQRFPVNFLRYIFDIQLNYSITKGHTTI